MLWLTLTHVNHNSDVMMGAMASQITGVLIVYSTVCSGADQRKHQSSASLAFVRGIHRWPVNSPHKRPVTRKRFPIDDVIMKKGLLWWVTRRTSSLIEHLEVKPDKYCPCRIWTCLQGAFLNTWDSLFQDSANHRRVRSEIWKRWEHSKWVRGFKRSYDNTLCRILKYMPIIRNAYQRLK